MGGDGLPEFSVNGYRDGKPRTFTVPEALRIAASATPTPRSAETLLAGLRAHGWQVGVHNDYRLNGVAMTFWLLTKDNRECVKGEGTTDALALDKIEAELERRAQEGQ